MSTRGQGPLAAAVHAHPGRLLAAVLIAGTAARVLLAATLPLLDDEAYYWLWSKMLAGSYLDHPPLIAFLIRLGTFAGDGELWVRLGSLLAGVATTLALYALGRELFDVRAGLVAAAVYQVVPILAGGGLLATPDTPLFLWWTLALLFARRALWTDARWWVPAGVATGLGMLSKFPMVLLPAGILGFAATRRHAVFRQPWVYAGAAVALALFTPVLIWNASHGWANVRFILYERLWEQPRGLPGLLAMAKEQLALVGFPILAFLGVLGGTLRRYRDDRFSFVLWTSIPPFILMGVVAALAGTAHGIWAGPAYLGLAVGLGGLWPGRLAALAIAANAAILATVALAPVAPWLPIDPGLTEELAGWREAEQRVEALAAQVPGPVVVAADRYKIAAQIAYHTRRRLPATIFPAPLRDSIWPLPSQFADATAILVLPARWRPWERPESFFEVLTEKDPLIVSVRGKEVRRFRFWIATGRKPQGPSP